jgi:purine-nucleoside phosphorylase
MSALVAGRSGTIMRRMSAECEITGPPADVSVIPTGSGWRRLEAVLGEICCYARVVGLGFCGGVDPSVGIGEIVIPLNAVPLPGVPQLQVPAHAPLAQALVDASQRIAVTHTGTIATAPRAVRAGMKVVRDLTGMGVLGVDMETSWLFARIASMSVPCAAILVCSDHVTRAPLMGHAERSRRDLPLTRQAATVARSAFRLALRVLAEEGAQR